METSQGSGMSKKTLTFDVDAESLAALHQALPDYEIQALAGTTVSSLTRGREIGEADLLVIGAHSQAAETLGLCRELRSQAGQAHTTLVVLVPPAHEDLVSAALVAGAQSCLVLPVHAKDFTTMLSRSHAGNRPGHHTLNLEPAQRTDLWQDDGGQG